MDMRRRGRDLFAFHLFDEIDDDADDQADQAKNDGAARDLLGVGGNVVRRGPRQKFRAAPLQQIRQRKRNACKRSVAEPPPLHRPVTAHCCPLCIFTA